MQNNTKGNSSCRQHRSFWAKSWQETNLRANLHTSKYHRLILELECYQNVLPPQIQSRNVQKILIWQRQNDSASSRHLQSKHFMFAAACLSEGQAFKKKWKTYSKQQQYYAKWKLVA